MTEARLVGGASPRQGLLELQLDGGGPFQPFCQTRDTEFPDAVPAVACAQLGFGGGVAYAVRPGGGSYSARPYWGGVLECDGTESELSQCRLPLSDTRGCEEGDEGGSDGYFIWAACDGALGRGRAGERVPLPHAPALPGLRTLPGASTRRRPTGGRSCGSTSQAPTPRRCFPALPAGAVEVEDVRLAGGSTPGEGRVEVQVNGTWGTLCGSGPEAAASVCCQLGFADAALALERGGSLFGNGSLPIAADILRCPGDEGGLEACHLAAAGDHECRGGLLGVACNGSAMPAAVRLAGGPTEKEGRLEVQLVPSGPWGAACASTLPFEAEAVAQVVCRQLGLNGGAAQPAGAYRGAAGEGDAGGEAATRPLLSGLSCNGSESALAGCSFSAPVQAYECGSADQGLGIACEGACPHVQSAATWEPCMGTWGPDGWSCAGATRARTAAHHLPCCIAAGSGCLPPHPSRTLDSSAAHNCLSGPCRRQHPRRPAPGRRLRPARGPAGGAAERRQLDHGGGGGCHQRRRRARRVRAAGPRRRRAAPPVLSRRRPANQHIRPGVYWR